MTTAKWIACHYGCGGFMQVSGTPPRYVCDDCGKTWEVPAFSVPNLTESSDDGVIEGWGLYDDLLLCVSAGEPWLEYGIIEYRYRLQFPSKFRDLVEERGHRNFPVGNFTASKLIGQAAGILVARGQLVQHVGTKGSGFWHYNDPTYWYAVPPPPSTSKLVTWVQYLDGALGDPKRDEADVMSERAIRQATPE
jgi:hypothetical protein